jgi:hypothetical protein
MSCAPNSAHSSSDSAPYAESDSRSNAIRIKRSRTPAQSLKFDVQLFQRVTNSRIIACDRCPLVSGDYKLRGRGGSPRPYSRTVQPYRLFLPQANLLFCRSQWSRPAWLRSSPVCAERLRHYAAHPNKRCTYSSLVTRFVRPDASRPITGHWPLELCRLESLTPQ